MTRRNLTLTVGSALALCAAVCPVAAQTPAAQQDVFSGVQRLVAVGDIHGDDSRFGSILRLAGLVAEDGKWSGGAAHLVVTGDFLDRGTDARRLMDRLMSLQTQAEAAGGRVHVLIGNHEAMNLGGDLRYVRTADYESFRTPQSKPSGDKAAGWREREAALGTKGIYGQWLRSLPAIIKVNDAIFVHGGISASYAKDSIEKINRSVRNELKGTSLPAKGYTVDEDGPLWYRGLVRDRDTDKGLISLVDRVLATHGASRIVVGHTIVPLVLPRFGGKVLAIDTGLSAVYGDGPQGFLVIEDGKAFSYHRGKKLPLPEIGASPNAYVAAALSLDPPDSALRKAIEQER